MDKQSADLALYQNINLLASESRHFIIKLAESFHLTASQLHSLMSLEPGKPVPMKHLCQFLACDASYITTIIDRLHAKKLIERHESPGDRRIKMISLTKKGEHVRQLAINHLPDFAPFAQLSPTEYKVMQKLLAKMVDTTK
jgi:DNA-binding MarR family transcriptional regulator